MALNVTGNFTFCPPNVTLSQLWVEHGLSPCLVDTIVASSSLAFILVFGTIQSLFYRKYATEVQHYALPFSQLFGVQVTVNAAMPVIAIVRLLLEIYLFKEVYGHMALAAANYIIVWPIVLMMIIKERNFMLPTTPTKGHGLVLLIFWTGNFAYQNLMLINILNPDWFFKLKDSKDIWLFSLFVVQYVFSGVIFLLGLRAPGIPSIRHSDSFSRLTNEGEFTSNQMPETNSQGSAWNNMGKKIKMLLPFIWPSGSFWLQLNVMVCFVSLIGGRVTNVFVPIYSKYIVDSMTIETTNSSSVTSVEPSMMSLFGAGGKLMFRWDYVVILVALKVIQGGGAGTSGLLSNLRSLLWVKVSQYTTREVQIRFFGHLHNLGLRWHLSRKTGEVMRAMDRGTDSVNSILNYVLFSIFPTIVDIIVAIVYFTMFFNIWFGLIVFITMVVYLVATFVISEWRTKFRRTMNTADNLQKQRAVDSLLNFETVKYFANEDFELERYEEAILKYQKEEWIVSSSLMVLNMIQLLVINGGLLIGSLLCVKMVVSGQGLTVGDYVLFSSYLVQLYTPLNYFGTYYRMLQKCFIDMENMMDLFKEEEEVKDEPYAEDLQLSTGTIEFKNVSFSYLPQKSVLRDVSFVVPGGKTFAIVGATGSGKTSLMRLLFRFYDVTSGSIFIDGQDVRTVTQVSLRKSIGVVPQDTVLFNDTIHYNIKYGDVNASDYQIIDAAKGAHIHESILSFPERYDTVVGERGLKLSGGEKQRMAIARAILKKPAIILLDEATSALDTRTERQIQASLYQLCENRTSIIVAHRLSTVINADNIIVLSSEGTIAEQGKHDELLAQNGLYSSMWNEQLKTDAAGAGTVAVDPPKPEEE